MWLKLGRMENNMLIESKEEYEQLECKAIIYDERYYDDIYEALEDCSCDLNKEEYFNIKFMHGAEKDRVELNAYQIIKEMEIESCLENFKVDSEGYKELYTFLKEWNEKYGTDRYCENENIVIVVSDELKNEYWRE